METTREYTEQ